MFHPIVRAGEIQPIHPDGDVAVCCFWTPVEKIRRAIYENGGIRYDGQLMPYRRVACMGQLYTPQGIYDLITNLAANPQIRLLYLIGKDLRACKEELISQIAGGISLTGQGDEGRTRTLHYIPHVEVFDPTQVLIHGKPAQHKIVILPETPEPEDRPVSLARSHHIETTSMYAAWREITRTVMLTGRESESRYGNVRSCRCIVASFQSSEAEEKLDVVLNHLQMTAEELDVYCDSMSKGTGDPELSYTYGERIAPRIDVLREKIGADPPGRSMVVPLWHPEDENLTSPPCLITGWLTVDDGVLHSYWVARSHDMWSGWPVNVMGLRAMLNYRFGDKFKLGTITTVSLDAHLYERSWPEADHLLALRHIQKDFPDPKGWFMITAEEDHILVRHYSRSGDKLTATFKGTTAATLSKKIEPYVSSVGHALYLGRQLQDAEERFKQRTGVWEDTDSSVP